jgi:phosphoglycolate phosphatase
MKRFFFFDLDGTLVDSRDDMANAVNAVRENLGLELRDINHIKTYVNKGMHEIYINCFDDYLSHNENYNLLYEKVKKNYEKNYLENIYIYSKCYDGIENVMKQLSKNDKVFVITNKPEIHSRELLKKLGLYSFITDVMGGDSCAEMKPSSLPLKIVSERHGFCSSSDKAYMIGDSAGDIKSGKGFGAVTVWCSWGYHSIPDSDSPQFTVNLPHELFTIV